MVRRLPCNWKRIDNRNLIGNMEFAPVEPMRRAGCRGEVRSCRLVSRDISSLGNRRGVMMMIAYLTPSSHRLVSIDIVACQSLEKNREKERAEAQGKGEGVGVLTAFSVVVDLLLMADGKRPRDEGSSAPPRGLSRVCRELFRGRYFFDAVLVHLSLYFTLLCL